MSYTVFVADDDQGILEAVSLLLEEEGYRVVVSHDSHVVSNIVAEKPDLVLLDIWMSGLDGRVIASELKKYPETNTIPIIMVSAHKDILKIANEAGADAFISKPFEINDLLDKIKYFLP